MCSNFFFMFLFFLKPTYQEGYATLQIQIHWGEGVGGKRGQLIAQSQIHHESKQAASLCPHLFHLARKERVEKGTEKERRRRKRKKESTHRGLITFHSYF